MEWPPQNTGVFERKLDCCACRTTCPEFLYVWPSGQLGIDPTPYANTTLAAAAMVDKAVSCKLWSLLTLTDSTGYINDVTYSDTGSSIDIGFTRKGDHPGSASGRVEQSMWIAIKGKAGQVITVDMSLATTVLPAHAISVAAVQMTVWKCPPSFNYDLDQYDLMHVTDVYAQTSGDEGDNSVSVSQDVTLPDDSVYWLFIDHLGNQDDGSQMTGSIGVSSADNFDIMTIQAMYGTAGSPSFLPCTP